LRNNSDYGLFEANQQKEKKILKMNKTLYIILLIIIEIVALLFHYLCVVFGKDKLLVFLPLTIVLFSSIFVILFLYSVVLFFLQKTPTETFVKFFLLNLLGALTPWFFLFFLFSRLH